MRPVSRGIDRIGVTFDEPNLVANAGLLLVATLVVRLGLERLINTMVHLQDGSAAHHLVARCSPWCTPSWRVARTSTTPTCCARGRRRRCCRIGSWHRPRSARSSAPSPSATSVSSTPVLAEALRRAWALGAGPRRAQMVMDLDSTICEVCGKAKGGASYGYTHRLGYHPLVATWAATGEVLHARLRKGAANTHRGAVRSSKSSSPGCAGPGRPASSSCALTRAGMKCPAAERRSGTQDEALLV